MRKSMGLERARSQKHTLETLQGPISELRKKFPMAGACEMTSLLFHEKGMSVSRSVCFEMCFAQYLTKSETGTWLFYTSVLLRRHWSSRERPDA